MVLVSSLDRISTDSAGSCAVPRAETSARRPTPSSTRAGERRDPSGCYFRYVRLPDVAITAVAAITRVLNGASEDDKVMAVDCEWEVGAAEAHVVQIGLLDGRWSA